MLELANISKTVGGQTHIAETSLVLAPGAFNILLGPTLSGKTTLMRLMAGLEQPTTGRLHFNKQDVTGLSVRRRDVAMVYQQFINYPTLTVYENIASPLRASGESKHDIDRRVQKVAGWLKLAPLLKRKPQELSGGQQQRVAIARALVKNARLVLLDEPLVNLDFKLREELREELLEVFAGRESTVVYATTDPTEALLLGGNTATLHEGAVTQFGPTREVFYQPQDLLTARTFSNPPLNEATMVKSGNRISNHNGLSFAADGGLKSLAENSYTFACRPYHLLLSEPDAPSVAHARGKIQITEIAGSESFLHLDVAGHEWVAQTHEIRDYQINAEVDLFIDTRCFMVFDSTGRTVAAPEFS